jgi:HlyD family secretion protein
VYATATGSQCGRHPHPPRRGETLANATIVTKSVDELLARQARREAEREGMEEIAFPKALFERMKDSRSEAGRAIAAERLLFDLRRQSRSGQKAQLKERSAQLQKKGYGLKVSAVG